MELQEQIKELTATVLYRLGDVKNHNGSLSAAVVHRSQAVVSLLSCSVPDLKLDCGVVQTHRLSQEGRCTDRRTAHVHSTGPVTYTSVSRLLTSYGCFLELIKLPFDKPQHQAGFAYSHVTQQHQFELANLGLRQGAAGADSTPSGVHSSLYWRRLGVLGLLPLWSEALLLSSKLNMIRLSLFCQN